MCVYVCHWLPGEVGHGSGSVERRIGAGTSKCDGQWIESYTCITLVPGLHQLRPWLEELLCSRTFELQWYQCYMYVYIIRIMHECFKPNLRHRIQHKFYFYLCIQQLKLYLKAKYCLRVSCRQKTHKNPCDLDLWPTLKFNVVLEVVEIHVRAKFHQANCSASWVFMFAQKNI